VYDTLDVTIYDTPDVTIYDTPDVTIYDKYDKNNNTIRKYLKSNIWFLNVAKTDKNRNVLLIDTKTNHFYIIQKLSNSIQGGKNLKKRITRSSNRLRHKKSRRKRRISHIPPL
jgi:hypothetical protein